MSEQSSLLIIDGFNVLHAVVLVGRDRAGWWQPVAQRRLIEHVEQLTDLAYQPIWVVFDRRPSRDGVVENVTSDDPRIHVMYAPSADDWIVEAVERHSPQQKVTVVTADRPLRERVRRAGGGVLSPRHFLFT